MSRMDLRLAGSGGQGVILASVILAEAAILAEKNAAQSQSYGPEARGGSCKAEVIISDEKIGFTKVVNPTFLMALTQSALDKYGVGLSENCIVLIDDGLNVPKGLEKNKVYRVPILKTAEENVGRLFTANIVAVGVVNAILGLVDDDSLRHAVLMHIPAGTEPLNEKALNCGIELGHNCVIWG